MHSHEFTRVQDADNSTLKRAYYKQAKLYHPDKNESEYAAARFKRVGEAYEANPAVISSRFEPPIWNHHGVTCQKCGRRCSQTRISAGGARVVVADDKEGRRVRLLNPTAQVRPGWQQRRRG